MHERIDAVIADHNLGPHSISGVEAVFKIRELVGMPVPIIMLTAVQRGDVVNEFQRVMQEHLLADPTSTAVARSPTEEPIVLQKPTTAAVLNNSLGELLGLTTLPMVRAQIPPAGIADTVPPKATAG
jgi:CheY-like chemotaxis protein